MITMQTDIRMSLEDLKISFQRLLNEKNDEFTALISQAIESYDFEKMLTEHIHTKLDEAIHRHVRISSDTIDLISLLFNNKIKEHLNDK